MEKVTTEFDRAFTAFATECFRIAGWVGLVAGFIVAGKKLQAPIAVLIGYALFYVACFYVGIKIDTLFAYARYGNKPRHYSKWNMLYVMLGSVVFALAMIFLFKTVMQSLSL